MTNSTLREAAQALCAEATCIPNLFDDGVDKRIMAVPTQRLGNLRAALSQEGDSTAPASEHSLSARLVDFANELDAEATSGAQWSKAKHTCVSVGGALRDVAKQVAELEDTTDHLAAALRKEIEAPVFLDLTTARATLSSTAPVAREPIAWTWTPKGHSPRVEFYKPKDQDSIPLYAAPQTPSPVAPEPAREREALPDTQRLDWLVANGIAIERDIEGAWRTVQYRRYGNPIRGPERITLRGAIDAARAALAGDQAEKDQA